MEKNGGLAPEMKDAPLGKDLQITSWTPDDVDLPLVPLPGMQQTKFMAQHTFDARDAKAREVMTAEPKPCTLDGFRLLDVCQVEFPDQARHVDVSGLNAVKVVAEDLAFFSNLMSIDVGRNALPFEPMAAFPNLTSLRMPCNGLKALCSSPEGTLQGKFPQLTHLDLSYNMLSSATTMTQLAELPNLRVLDLTCNGMKTLPGPEDMRRFRNLARLVLERNQIESPDVLVSCSACPRLEELHIGLN